VPQIQFPELLDAERPLTIRVDRGNHMHDARKKSGPSVSARAKLVKILSGYRARGPVTRRLIRRA
jgi:hypothetical protein